MEKGTKEGAPVKPKPDYEFNPNAAGQNEWLTYLLNDKNFEKDFTVDISEMEEIIFPVPAEDIAKKFRESGVAAETIKNAVDCALTHWDEIFTTKDRLREIHPFDFIVQLAGPEHIDIVKRLWTEAPQDSALLDKGLVRVIDALRKDAPVTQEELEKLYIEHFKEYSFIAIEIMLARGQAERATELFIAHAAEYGKGFDPIVFDRLVYAGLPGEAAKVWLDQSDNAKPGYEGHYDHALERWKPRVN